ncbi:MAG: glycosyltransferase [Gammaproteobacteria bacterium]|nr:glycosyltransferase [Gammaproteobacteria bacterium]
MIGTLGPGGAERQAVITLLGLAGLGFQPLAMAAMDLQTDAQRFFLHKLEEAGVSVAELDRDPAHDDGGDLPEIMRVVGTLPRRLTEVMNFARTLVKQNPQVAHLWLDEVNIRGGLAAVAAGVPRIVLHVRSLPPHNFALYRTYMLEGYRWLAKQPAVTLAANSIAGAHAYEAWLGLPAGHIQVIHNGFDFDEDLSLAHRNERTRTDYRSRHGIPPAALLVGTVIRFSEEKRPGLWADIAELVARALPDTHFLMVGDGYLRSRIARRANSGELAGRLHVVGYEKQALAAIAAMDLFLLTSRAEGLPNVLIEAQALGVPVVTTTAGGAAETLLHGRTGWVLADDSPEAAAAVIVRLLADRSWLRQAGKEAREFVRTHFGMDQMLDETLRVYGPGLRAAPQGAPTVT